MEEETSSQAAGNARRDPGDESPEETASAEQSAPETDQGQGEEPPAPGDESAPQADEIITDDELSLDLQSGDLPAPPPDYPAIPGDDANTPAIAAAADAPAPESGALEADAQGEPPEQQDGAGIPPKPKPCKEAVEALLFAAESPLTPMQISALLGKAVKPGQVKEWIDQLTREYDETGRAFQAEEIAGGWRVMTRPEYGHYVRTLRVTEKSSRLSEAAIDTLSVVAYKQPIIKADINQIRGVESGPILKTLIEKNLVKAVGRSEVAGRPIMYGTSRKFLDHFGLKSLKDLPKPEK